MSMNGVGVGAGMGHQTVKCRTIPKGLFANSRIQNGDNVVYNALFYQFRGGMFDPQLLEFL